MPLVGPEAEQHALTECRYRYPTETLKDLQSVRARFRDLRLFVDFYCFPNKETRKLLHLSGTLPVLYQGSAYNIPVCVWLHETHPLSHPRCVVCPSVAMVINPSCPHVDSSGTVSVDGLRNWTPGVSNLTLLLSEMRLAFQKDTPLYARSVDQAPPPAGLSSSPSSQQPQSPAHGPAHLTEASQWEQDGVRTSYTEELKGIDFRAPPSSGGANPFLSPCPPGAPPTEPLNRMMGALRLDGGRRSEPNLRGSGDQSPAAEADLRKVSAHLSPDRAAVFMALITMTGRSFSTDDVIEAVQHNPDLPSALKFLTHTCPICRDQVSFSKIITMTHCSCFLCQSCFTSCFSVAIKERAVHQLTCPQCGQPEIRSQGALEESMDYFNLLDTQIRHFLPPDIHELFQRKLRDRALQEMPRFCWCAHDVVSRWGPKQKMVLEQLPAIRRVLAQDRKHGHLNPTWQDVLVLDSINAAMKPLADLQMSSQGKHTSVKPVLDLIKGDHLSPGHDGSTLTASITQNIPKTLTEKYSSPAIQALLRKATILDLRYCGSMEEAVALDDIKHQLVQELLDLKGSEVSKEGEGCSKAAGGNKDDSTAAPPPRRRG